MPQDSRSAECERKIHGSKSVAIHVRRGDYLNYVHVLPVLPIEYYASAIDRAVRQWNVERFVVYTDDVAWVRLHLLPRLQSYRIELSTQRGAIDDFVGLTECRWLITANSTFSVMAARIITDLYLGRKNPDAVMFRFQR